LEGAGYDHTGQSNVKKGADGEIGSDRRSAAMEFLVIVLGLCALGLLAGRYGYDSRGQLRSREEEAASVGMTWDAPPRH
jgi:hypothetical protein